MTHLIDRDALVAEIDRLENKLYYEPENFKDVGAKMALDSLKSSLDTLEVKEVDLNKSLTGFIGRYAYENGGEYPSAIDIAKHFFELGMSVSNKS